MIRIQTASQLAVSKLGRRCSIETKEDVWL